MTSDDQERIPSNDALRKAYRDAVEQQKPASRDACPTADELAELAARETVDEGTSHIARLEHVMSCVRCRPEYELLRATNVVSRENSTIAHETRYVAPSPFPFRKVGIAAALVLSAGIGGSIWQQYQSRQVRTTEASDVVLISPKSATTGGLSFTWRRVDGAASYHIEVLDTTGAVVVQETTSDTTLSLIASDSAKVSSLNAFDWIVTARRIDGNERSSPLTRVRVTAR